VTFKPTNVVKLLFSRFILSGVLLGVLGLTSCQSDQILRKEKETITPIADLNWVSAEVKSVYVRGNVLNRAPLLDRAAYQLQDETGQVWVITDNSPPESGQTVTIQAKIRTKSIELPQQQVSKEVYLQELKQLP